MKLRFASMSLLTVCCLMLAVAPAMAGAVYSNGPYNGTTNAWEINFGFAVSDSYVDNLTPDAVISALVFVYWDPVPGDVLTSIDAHFGPLPFSGNTHTYTTTNTVDLGRNQFGDELYETAAFINPGIPPLGEAFMTLSNACTASGCNTTPIYWDENSGIGCDFPGCPSTAYENVVGSIPSESFLLLTSPEPSSIMLFGSGVLGLAGVLRRKLKIWF